LAQLIVADGGYDKGRADVLRFVEVRSVKIGKVLDVWDDDITDKADGDIPGKD